MKRLTNGCWISAVLCALAMLGCGNDSSPAGEETTASPARSDDGGEDVGMDASGDGDAVTSSAVGDSGDGDGVGNGGGDGDGVGDGDARSAGDGGGDGDGVPGGNGDPMDAASQDPPEEIPQPTAPSGGSGACGCAADEVCVVLQSEGLGGGAGNLGADNCYPWPERCADDRSCNCWNICTAMRGGITCALAPPAGSTSEAEIYCFMPGS